MPLTFNFSDLKLRDFPKLWFFQTDYGEIEQKSFSPNVSKRVSYFQ